MTSRILLSIASAAVLTLFTFSTSSAQTSAQDRVDTLRLQLEEVKTKQLDLESRLKLLEQQSQPENIQNSLAGVGSTKPEDLRELKRKQLESEKASVQKQLSVLSESRNRLETGIAQAEARAYQESANGTTTATEKISDSTVTQPLKQRPRRVIKRTRTRRS